MSREVESKNTWEIIRELISGGNIRELINYLYRLGPQETARAISRLEKDEQTQLLLMLDADEAAEIIDDVPLMKAAELIENLSPEKAAAIVEEMPTDYQVDLLSQLKHEDAANVLEQMSEEDAHKIKNLISYPPETAGGLMIDEFLTFRPDQKVKDVIIDLKENQKKYAEYNVQYLYLADQGGVLKGLSRIRDLLFQSHDSALSESMIKNPHTVDPLMPLEGLNEFFDRYPLYGAPVVDDKGKLLGVVRRADVEEAVSNKANQQLLKIRGIIGGEELSSMPIFKRSGRRMAWLSINIILNVIAASVIALYQETLQALIVLAVFLPMISDMSGCSGNQAVGVSVRELSLGLVRPHELALVLWKEMRVGMLNGLMLGLLLGGIAYLWKGNFFLSLVVGSSLAINTVVSVCIGGSLPLILKRLKLDPALVSGPILTTVTDMCGFFFVLGFASVLMGLGLL